MYLYIMGRGHSGSTILEILLGNSSRIESVGEMLYGLNRSDRETCGCGATVSDCVFWREVRSRVEAEGVAWDEVCGMVDRGWAGLWRVWRAGQADPAMVRRRAQVTRALALAATETAGKAHLLDSCKTPTHGLLLLKYLPEARVIHLVRDPRPVLQSYIWRMRTGRHLGPRQLNLARRSSIIFLTSIASGWTPVNLACDLMARAFPGRVVRVRYEDLCAQPTEELQRIGRAFGLDLAELDRKAAGQEPLPVGHNIGGNHLRLAGTVRFDPGSGRRQGRLPRWLAVVSLLLCGPLMWRYGYPLSGCVSRPERSTAALSG